MPIMIPINVQQVPTIPLFNMDDYVQLVSRYATELWKTMNDEEQAKFAPRGKSLSDDELANELSTLPDYESCDHADMSQLTKADYQHFIKSHTSTKGLGYKIHPYPNIVL